MADCFRLPARWRQFFVVVAERFIQRQGVFGRTQRGQAAAGAMRPGRRWYGKPELMGHR